MAPKRTQHAKRFAFNQNDQGFIEYIGVVHAEAGDSITIRPWNALTLLLIGLVEETDELVVVPRSACRVFLSEVGMLSAAGPLLRAANEYHKRQPVGCVGMGTSA